MQCLASSVARGERGGSSPPHWLVKNAKSYVLCAFEADFLRKMENSPPIRKQPLLKRLNMQNWTKNQSRYRWRPFFFWRPPKFGRKKPLNFGFRPKKTPQFWWRPFFFFFVWRPPIWISELSEKFRLNFRTNRLKLLLDQWKFQSRSFAHFSLFQNSPPLFQILATCLCLA